MRNIGGEYGVRNEREECNEIIMYMYIQASSGPFQEQGPTI